jgi:hypothetical protein
MDIDGCHKLTNVKLVNKRASTAMSLSCRRYRAHRCLREDILRKLTWHSQLMHLRGAEGTDASGASGAW